MGSENLLIILSYWWIPILLIMLKIFWDFWVYYIQNNYLANLEWVLLEIHLPEQVKTTPKAMEQLMAGLHGAYKGPNLQEKYIKGMLLNYFSLEIVGIDGNVHFYIRTETRFRNMVEGHIYAQYPDAEITEAEDYTKKVPKEIPNQNWNLWGAEMHFTNEEYYPIRTYPNFKDEEVDEGVIDPLASLVEAMSHSNPGEQIWVQILIQPTHDTWQDKGKELVNKLIERPGAKKKGFLENSIIAKEAVGWGDVTAKAVFGTSLSSESENKEDKKPDWPSMMQHLSPGEKNQVEAIENKCSKIGFNSKIRFIYLGKKDIFSMGNVSAFMGSFKQFAFLDLNGFKPDPKTKSSIDYLFKSRRSAYRRRKILVKYRWRSMSGHTQIMNIEEVASLYHFPGLYIKTPRTPRIEAKKGSPPVELPVN